VWGKRVKVANDSLTICHDYFSIFVPTTRGSPNYQVFTSRGGGPRHVGVLSKLIIWHPGQRNNFLPFKTNVFKFFWF
jgi:hypothetical protein